MSQTHTSEVSAIAEIYDMLDRVADFYGHPSYEARLCARIKRMLDSQAGIDKHVKECPTCKCPLCGKTRAQAAEIQRARARAGFKKYAEGKYLNMSQPTTDLPSGFTLADIDKAKEEAEAYIISDPYGRR